MAQHTLNTPGLSVASQHSWVEIQHFGRPSWLPPPSGSSHITTDSPWATSSQCQASHRAYGQILVQQWNSVCYSLALQFLVKISDKTVGLRCIRSCSQSCTYISVLLCTYKVRGVNTFNNIQYDVTKCQFLVYTHCQSVCSCLFLMSTEVQ